MGIGYDALVVHYSEIFLKGPQVKRHFEQILMQRIWQKLQWEGFSDFQLSIKDHSLWVYGQISLEMAPVIAKVFGVRYVTAVLTSFSSLSAVKESAKQLSCLANSEDSLTFRIKAKKEKGLSTATKTFEIEASDFFSFWKLNLNDPDIVIHINIKKKYSNIGYLRFEGPGGLPYGSSGKVLALVSKGIDSAVAAWLISKRGCETILLHFGEESIDSIAHQISISAGKTIKIIHISHVPFLQLLKSNHAGKYLCILCKMGMLYAAQHYCEITGSKAIVTGENLGQVASQTLDNLSAMTQVFSYPILRPLLTYDKESIVDLAKIIGTYNIYANPSCSFVPSHPSTSVSYEKLNELIKSDTFQHCLNEWKKTWRYYES